MNLCFVSLLGYIDIEFFVFLIVVLQYLAMENRMSQNKMLYYC